jgi:hypothetical protein
LCIQCTFWLHRFTLSSPIHNVTTVTSLASWSETSTRHPAKPATSPRAPASEAGIADCTRCVSCGLATNSTLKADKRGAPFAWATGRPVSAADVRGEGIATFFERLGYCTGLATVPPWIWPTLLRGEAHSHPFRAGSNAPIGAHGDRRRIPIDEGRPSLQRSHNGIVGLTPISFQLARMNRMIHCPEADAKIYSTAKNSRPSWNSFRSTKRT